MITNPQQTMNIYLYFSSFAEKAKDILNIICYFWL